ncbi:MAG TPA: OmpA family protein [Myxococcota bacterium]
MKSIKNFSLRASLLAAAAVTGIVGGACATAAPPTELVSARRAYTQAEISASTAAPTELRSARLALDHAEKSFQDKGNDPVVRDKAYIALRKAELATAAGETFVAMQKRDANNEKLRSLGLQAANDLRSTQKNLTQAEREAAERAAQLAATQGDLNATKTQAQLAQQQAAGLAKDLESERGELAKSREQLEAEKAARMEAESRLTATLQKMSDLQSVKEETRGLVITLSGQVLFASGKYELLPAARKALDNVAEALKASGNRKITIEGHTDSQGSKGLNQTLSQNRAESVRSYLISRGIVETEIRAEGFGPDRPVAPNTTAEGRANNRRVEIVLAPAPAGTTTTTTSTTTTVAP